MSFIEILDVIDPSAFFLFCEAEELVMGVPSKEGAFNSFGAFPSTLKLVWGTPLASYL